MICYLDAIDEENRTVFVRPDLIDGFRIGPCAQPGDYRSLRRTIFIISDGREFIIRDKEIRGILIGLAGRNKAEFTVIPRGRNGRNGQSHPHHSVNNRKKRTARSAVKQNLATQHIRRAADCFKETSVIPQKRGVVQ